VNSQVKDGDTIVAWFSCGAASTIALRETLRIYGDRCKVRAVNNPILEEGEDNRRYLRDVERWLGIEIEIAINPKWPNCSAVEVWEDQRYLSGVAGASCTRALKKQARQHWESQNHFDWMVLGFCSDEQRRAANFRKGERDNLLTPLIDCGYTHEATKMEVRMAGLQLPLRYRLGFANGNCAGCVKATSPEYWNLTRTVEPEVFAARAELSRRLGVRLVKYKGERIFLDELPAEARGRALPPMPDCGLFCEEDAA
jgi:hypothetical protein